MNSQQVLPPEFVDFTFSRQAILGRNGTLWGSEVQVYASPAFDGERHDIHSFYFEQLKYAYSEALRRVEPTAFTKEAKRLHVEKQPVLYKFFRIEPSLLMNEDIVKEIIATSHTLKKHKQQLIISVENSLAALPDPAERRRMIHQLYRLKDRSSLKLAYSNYTFTTKPADVLSDLGLYDYIKMPFPDAALRLSLNTRSGLFDLLYDRMLGLMSASKVSFVADNVEHADSALLARRLPFDYFQGRYFSPADSL